MLPADVLEREDPRGLAAYDERHEEGRLRRLADYQQRVSMSLGRSGPVLVDHQRLAGLPYVLPEPDHRHRVDLLPYAALDRIPELGQPPSLGVDRDVAHLRAEDVADPVADDVVDRLQLELAGKSFLHAVDQRELGVPLPRLLDRSRAGERGADMLTDVGE